MIEQKEQEKREVIEILAQHTLWLSTYHSKGKRAIFDNRVFRYYADFRGLDLRYASFYNANLVAVNFKGADLRNCDFTHANLSEAEFSGANLRGAIGLPGIICPESGGFTAYKKVYTNNILDKTSYVVELYIPADAKRSSGTTRKCRCSKAKVVRFWNLDRTPADTNIGFSWRDRSFSYIKDRYVEPFLPFDEDRWRECASGIHFFLTFDEAAAW